MAAADFDPDRLLRALADANVRFVLIGGMAAVLHGDIGVTVDLDIVPERSPSNAAALSAALQSLDAKIRTESVPGGLPFDSSPELFRNLSPEAILNLTTSAGDLDLCYQPSGTQGFEDLSENAEKLQVADDLEVLVAALADIIRSKEAAGRPKDLAALPRLRQLLERLPP